MLKSRGLRSVLVGALIVGVIGGITTTALTLGDEDERPVTAAEPGQPSYALSNLRLQYPYLTDEGSLNPEKDPSRVGVMYDTAWATEAYPGVAMCRFDVKDSSGGVIGSLTGDVQSMQPFAAGRSWMPISVSGAPASAEAVCSLGETPSPDTGYVFSNLRVEGSGETGDRLHVVGDVAWKTSESPGTGDCMATLTVGGQLETWAFTLGSGEATDRVIALLPSSMRGATVEVVECVPLVEVQP